MKTLTCLFPAIIVFVIAAHAGDVKETGRFNLAPIPRIMTAPKIDGEVGKAEWYGATLLPRLIGADDGAIAGLRSRVYVAYDDANLYVAFQIDRPANSILPAESDMCQLLLDPAHAHKAVVTFAGNVAGPMAGKDWQYKAHATDFGWEGELAIPFASLQRSLPQPGEVWGLDFVNRQATPVEAISGYSYGKQPNLNHVIFTGSAPVVRFIEAGSFFSETGGGASVELVNLTGQPADATISLEVLRRTSGSTTYLKGIAHAFGTEDSDIVLPASDLAAMVKEHLAHYTPTTNVSTKADLPGNRRTEYRVAATEPGDYLCRYRVQSGNQVIADGVLPFRLSAPLQIEVKPFFLSPGVLDVRVDLRRVPEWVKGAKLKFSIAKKAGQAALSTAEKPFEGPQQFAVEVPAGKLAAGGYELTTELVGADGKQKALFTEGFTKLATPAWFTQPVGNTPVVPPPWTPIKASAKKVSFLMGDYELAKSLWPQQIRVRSVYEEKRAPLLRGPMVLKGRVNGKEVVWEDGKTKTVSKKDDLIELEGEQRFDNLSVKSAVSFEYDGMAKVVMDLTPQADAKPAIDALWLEVPLTPEVSKLFQYAPTPTGMKGTRNAGEIPANETMKFEFMFSVWLGDEVRGFRWFAENWKGWHLGTNAVAEAIEVINTPEGATLRLNFFKGDKPFVLEKPRQIIFGYMFTPPKPLDSRLLCETVFSDRFQYEEPAGATVAEAWYYKYQGWPEIYSDKERAEKLANAQYAHKHNILIVPYSGWFIARDSDAYKAFGPEMVSEPVANGGCGCDVCCWNTSVTDVYTSLLADRVRDTDIDGFRLDAGFSADNCFSLVHRGYGSQCGWIDDNGKLQPSRGIFAARKAAQRAYRVFHGGAKNNGMCLQHIHQGNRYDPILSHMDGVVSAEGGEMKMKKLSEFPLGFFRGNVMGDAHGYRVIYMPKAPAVGFDVRYGLNVIHNLVPRGYPIVGMREVSNSRSASSCAGAWQAYRWINVTDLKHTEFWGYWRNAAYLSTGDTNVVGSIYVRRGEKLLLGLLNLERAPVERTIKIDFQKLGFGKQIYARDANTFDEIPVTDNSVTLDFTGEGWRLIEFAAKPINPFVPEKISENLIPEIAPGKWDGKALPAGWYGGPVKGLTVKDGQLVITDEELKPKGINWSKALNAKKGQTFLLEAEVRLDCAAGEAYMDPNPEAAYFKVIVGELYFNHGRSFGSQMLPGHYEKVRLWFTMNETPMVVSLSIRGKGTASIRKLELYEIKNVPPRPGLTP